MVGAFSIVGSSALDSHAGPCLCVDAMPTATSMNLKSGGDAILWKKSLGKKHLVKRGVMQLSSSFIDAGREWRLCVNRNPKKQGNRRLTIVNELGGQYEETFGDVKTVI